MLYSKINLLFPSEDNLYVPVERHLVFILYKVLIPKSLENLKMHTRQNNVSAHTCFQSITKYFLFRFIGFEAKI